MRTVILSSMVLTLLSCAAPAGEGEGEAGEGEGESSEGEGEGDAGEGEGEGEPPPQLQCPTAPEVVADDSLDGSNWTATTVRFPTSLTLCNVWSEGASLADEQVRKVKISMPAQAERTLHRNVMEASQLDGVVIERSPFRSGRSEGAVCSGNATLQRWERVASGDTDGLEVDVRYDFGDAGAVVESFRVFGNNDGVVIDGQYGVSSLRYVPPEGEEFEVAVAPCVPSIGVPEVAIEALVGQADNGDERVVYRVYRTEPVFAGSYPVDMLGIATLSFEYDYPSWSTASGTFSQTYAAEHHNWNDRSQLFFDRDPINWHLTFQPGVRTDGTAVSTVLFGGINNYEESAFEVTTHDFSSDVDTTTSYTVPEGGFRLVAAKDVVFAATAAGLSCPASAPVVIRGAGMLSSFSYALQLVTCDDDANGFTIVGVMPVAVRQLDAIGSLVTRLDETEIDGAPAVSFDIGAVAHTLAIVAPDVVVLNSDAIGPQYLPIRPLEVDPTTATFVSDERLVFRGAGVELTIARRWGAQGAGNSGIYAPITSRITWGEGQQAVAAALDDMVYENTHHNWDDTLVATDGDVEFRWAATTNLNDPACPEEDFLCYMVTVVRGEEVLLPTTRVTLEP